MTEGRMSTKERTRQIISEHYRRYPKMQITDYFKLLFHSSFGCEHAVSSKERAMMYILSEYEGMTDIGEAVFESLDGDYCRVYLSCLALGVSAENLADAFCSSAKVETDGRTRLEEKLAVLSEMVLSGEIPLDHSELDGSIKEWRELGYLAVRHSEVYRSHYHPAYRVVSIEEAEKLNGLIK